MIFFVQIHPFSIVMALYVIVHIYILAIFYCIVLFSLTISIGLGLKWCIN